jgi:glycosyltransferase 2 family protein
MVYQSPQMESKSPDAGPITKEGPELLQDTAANGKKGRWGTILRLVVSATLIGLVLVFVDFRTLVGVLAGLNLWYLLAGAVVIHLDRWVMAYKWNLLLAKLNVRVPLFVLFRAYIAAPVFQVILPSTVGTDLFRLYVLSRFKVDTQSVFASMILERLIGLVSIVLLVLLSFGLAFYVMGDQWMDVVGMGWGFLAGAIAFTVLVLAAGLGLVGLIKKMPQKLSQRFKLDKLRGIYALSAEYRRHPGTVTKVFIWTCFEHFLHIAVLYLMAYSLHIDASLVQLAVIVPLTTLALRLPISLDGIGVQEGMYVLLFSMIGVSPSEAFVLSMLRRVVPMLCALPWAIHHLFQRGAIPLPNQQTAVVGDASR